MQQFREISLLFRHFCFCLRICFVIENIYSVYDIGILDAGRPMFGLLTSMVATMNDIGF